MRKMFTIIKRGKLCYIDAYSDKQLNKEIQLLENKDIDIEDR